MRRLLIVVGSLAVLLAAADRARAWILQPEKDAFYAFGHWFDVAWEIDAPLFVIGVLLIVAGLFHGKRTT